MQLFQDLLQSAYWIVGGALGLALVIIGLAYIGLPLLIFFSHRQSSQPKLVPFQPGATPLPADVDQYFHSTSWALAQQGFEIITGVFLPSQVENIVCALILVVNRPEQDAGIVVAMHAKGPVPQTTFHSEFVTRYRDGRVVQTNNAEPLNAFPTPPQCINSYLPSVRDSVQLYQAHQTMCRKHGSGAKVLKLDEQYGGDGIRYLTDAMLEELEAATKVGIMRLDKAAGAYRPTLSGAFRMALGEMWPLKGSRLRKRAQRERQLLAELGMTAPAPLG
jgi:hypothetical protein